jgi:hypothetical protein
VTTKTTIYLDEALLQRMAYYVPLHDLSALVSELLEQRVQLLEMTDATMREGYFATRRQRRALNADWQTVDGEGWPE